MIVFSSGPNISTLQRRVRQLVSKSNPCMTCMLDGDLININKLGSPNQKLALKDKHAKTDEVMHAGKGPVHTQLTQ